MKKKLAYDLDSPVFQAAVRDIVHDTFVREGIMVAFPLSFPGATTSLPADESFITALDVAPDGTIYGGTSGRRTHLFVGMFHGVTGMVYDMGVVPGGTRCSAMCCGQQSFVACVNGPGGGRLVERDFEPLPFDLIQEWHMELKPFRQTAVIVKDEPIMNAVMTRDKQHCVGTTRRHLFTFDMKQSRCRIIAELPVAGRLMRGSSSQVFGWDSDQTLWRLDTKRFRLHRREIELPGKAWNPEQVSWAYCPVNDVIYVSDGDGRLWAFSEQTGRVKALGRIPLLPAGPMAVSLDGRLFGFCGDGMAHLFRFDPGRRTIRDLGCAVSVIERRRYGYQFGAAVMGRDGEIVFGEDDNMGHLWLYFPRIASRARAAKMPTAVK